MLKADLKDKLRALRLNGWIESWSSNMKMGQDEGMSLERLVTMMVEQEYHRKQGNALRRRINRASIEDEWHLSTYPFDRQPQLDRRKIMTVYDSMEYVSGHRNIVWVGPTGCGKTGLATSFLMQALDKGYSGRMVGFSQLVQELYQSAADHSEQKVLRPYIRCDCLVIDELGYIEVESPQVGMFFDLLHRRHKKAGTLITTNLGFREWGKFLKHAALLDRLTENCDVFNMSKCVSLRSASREF